MMKVQIVQFLVLVVSLPYCSAASENLRGGSERQDAIDDLNHEEMRFLNIFDESFADDEEDTPTRYMVQYVSPMAMARAQAKRNNKPPVMAMKDFNMVVLNIDSKKELKDLKNDNDVLIIEPGKVFSCFTF